MKRLHLTGLGALSHGMVDAALPHECAAPNLCYWCEREKHVTGKTDRFLNLSSRPAAGTAPDKREVEEALDVIENSPAGTPYAKHAKKVAAALRESREQVRAAERLSFAVQHFKECSAGSCDSSCKTKARGDMWEALAAYRSRYPVSEEEKK